MIQLGQRFLPPVVKNLLIINGLAFLATVVLNDVFGWDIVQIFGLSYFMSDSFRVWQIVTHLFLHGSFLHLFSNMFALWMFGMAIENRLGSSRFLKYYLMTGIGAAIIHSFVLFYEKENDRRVFDSFFEKPSPEYLEDIMNKYSKRANPIQFAPFVNKYKADPYDLGNTENAKKIATQYQETFLKNNIVTIGASGAVFGVLLAFGMLFPNMTILIWFILPMKAKYLVILYGLFELWSAAANNPADNIAHFAHLGGMLIGFILLKIWDIKKPFDYHI